ncbi:MAG: hypothetical protein JWP11_330, partial [Frankiales bacterium]|nr:hypothetical protein [Frankiales bacterium]
MIRRRGRPVPDGRRVAVTGASTALGGAVLAR